MVERVLITDGGTVASVVTIGRGSAADTEALIGDRRPRRVAVFSQESVRVHAEAIAATLGAAGSIVSVMALPDREAAKSLEVVEDAARRLNDFAMTRNDLIVGVGGGALTDAAGFIAATYLRGVAVTLVPTTLLGAVDASIGGKTAVNVDGKNLVGVFKHPERVAIDLDLVGSAPTEVLLEGHAEAMKAGFIADAALMARYEEDGADADLGEVVRRAVAVKAEIVSADFREGDGRAMLNYGHTIGHAVEVAGGMPHGHAVAIGMVAAGAAAEQAVGFAGADRQRAIIASTGLPTSVSNVDLERVQRLVELDKKRDDSGVRMVLLEDFGRPVLRPAGPATVLAALEAVGLE